MQFLYQPLTWGFFLVLVPLLIHLINLMRQRKVQWAAMEFLLKSHKKHRKWVWLKQFLLLASRMLAVAIAVAMLAHLVTKDQWTSFFGAKTTHHIVLLDDSYSMSDVMGTKSSFDRADQVLTRLASSMMNQNSVQRFTLMRFSGAARSMRSATGEETAEGNSEATVQLADDQVAGLFGQFADLNAVPVDADFDQTLQERRRTFDVSQLAVGPSEALRMTAELVKQADDESPIVYLISDFRSAEWQSPADAKAAIAELEEAGSRVNLVRCAEDEVPNLAIADLQPTAGTRAAGVPLFVDVTVTNFGKIEAKQVAVKIQATYFGRDDSVDDPTQRGGSVSDLPNVLIDRIAPGETVSRRAQVYFATAGQHVVTATLPADSIEADNSRHCVVDFPSGIPVLIVDGDPRQVNAAFLRSVFQPGERVQTGIRPEVQPLAFLRDATLDDLSKYRAIYLTDVARMDPLTKRNVEDFVRSGGGLAVFLGPNSGLDFYREWAAESNDGEPGFFPVPVDSVATLPSDDSGAPGLIVEDHPIFSVLLGEGKAYASAIRFQQYVSAPVQWKPPVDSSINIIAALRDGSPLAVEQAVGDGRVVAFLSTLAPVWNSWATQPTFPVMVLQTQSYLDSGRMAAASRTVGSPIVVQLDPARFQPMVDFLVPGLQPDKPIMIRRQATKPDGEASPIMQTGLGASDDDRASRTDKSGVYEAWPRTLDGELAVQRFAMNVNPREGDLTLSTAEELAAALADTKVELFDADDLSLGSDDDGQFSWSQFLMFALMVVLIIEQLLALSGSYHAKPGVAKA